MIRLREKSVACGLVCAVFGVFAGADAGVIDPRGVYFHSYTGPFSAIEWIDIRALDGEDRYQFSDIRGIAPYQGEILGGGQITWDTTALQSGAGVFSSQDDATMTLQYQGGTYHSTLRRAPGTDAGFITQIDSRVNGASSVNGQWNIEIQELNAQTGEVVGTQMTTAGTTVDGDLLMLTYADGTSFQGVFEESDHAGFRVVLPGGGLGGEFGSFAGSESSLTMNLLGDFRMTGADAFSATFLTQTRRQPGAQEQFVHVITASRVPAPGVSAVLGGFALLAGSRRRR